MKEKFLFGEKVLWSLLSLLSQLSLVSLLSHGQTDKQTNRRTENRLMKSIGPEANVLKKVDQKGFSQRLHHLVAIKGMKIAVGLSRKCHVKHGDIRDKVLQYYSLSMTTILEEK